MTLSNFKIGSRLGAAFALVLALLLGIAGLGAFNLGKVNDALDLAVNNSSRKTELLNTMSESVHVVQRVARTMVLLTDKAAIDREAPQDHGGPPGLRHRPGHAREHGPER